MLSAVGCLAGEQPLPPHEALARATQRINAILQDEGEVKPIVPEPGQIPADPNEISVWFYSHPIVSRVLLGQRDRLAAFANAHPEIKLKPQFIGEWDIAIQKLTVSLAAGDLPDVALVKRGWLARLIHAGRVAALDELLPPTLLDDVRNPARASFVVEGHVYALPADGFCSVLYYNRDLAPEPPATWDALRRVAAQVNQPNNDWRKATYALGDYPFIEALWSAGGEVCGPRNCDLAAPEAAEALDFVLSLRKEGLVHPRGFGDPMGSLDLFLMGKVVMTVASSEYLARIEKAAFPVGVAPVPGKNGPVSRLSDNAWVVFARHGSAKRQAVAEALAFLTGRDFQNTVPGSATTRSSLLDPARQVPGLEQAFLCARNTPLIAPWAAVEYELRRALDLAYRWSPDAAGSQSP